MLDDLVSVAGSTQNMEVMGTPFACVESSWHFVVWIGLLFWVFSRIFWAQIRCWIRPPAKSALLFWGGVSGKSDLISQKVTSLKIQPNSSQELLAFFLASLFTAPNKRTRPPACGSFSEESCSLGDSASKKLGAAPPPPKKKKNRKKELGCPHF